MKQPELPDNFGKKSMFEQYIFYYDYYLKLYGEKTIVLIQVGGFYELYGVENNTMKLGDVYNIACGLLHIEVSRRNKEVLENGLNNYLMAGFPLNSLGKYLDILVSNQYTVVQIDQVDPNYVPPVTSDESGSDSDDQSDRSDLKKTKKTVGEKKTSQPEKAGEKKPEKKAGKKVDRYVVEIHSPGTYFNETDFTSQNCCKYMVEIHIEGFDRLKKDLAIKTNYQPMIIGLSAIDVTTGHSQIYEVSNNSTDNNYALDEVYRFLTTYRPREVLLSSHHLLMSREDLEEYLDLREMGQVRCQITYNEVGSDYYKLSYQKQFLSKVFNRLSGGQSDVVSGVVSGKSGNQSILSVIEWLNLERMQIGLISYLMLLQYTYEHNEILLKNLEKPTILESQGKLLLANNTIQQLELETHSRKKLGSVLNMLDWTSTGMGKRMFRDRLLNPICSASELNSRYDRIDLFVRDSFWKDAEIKLAGIADLDRIHRRFDLGLISPNGCHLLNLSYRKVMDLLKIIPSDFFSSKGIVAEFQGLLNELDSIFDWDVCSKYISIDQAVDNIFRVKFHPELSAISDQIRENQRYIDLMVKRLSEVILDGKGADLLGQNSSDTMGTYLTVTAVRFNTLKNGLAKLPNGCLTYKVGLREFKISSDSLRIISSNKNKSQHHITSDDLIQISDSLEASVGELKKLIKVVYFETLSNISNKYRVFFAKLSSVVAEIDVCKSCARSVVQNGYCRPEIDQSQTSGMGSGLVGFKMRHPLIEKLHPECPYVPHSFQLGSVEFDPLSGGDKLSDDKLNGDKLDGEVGDDSKSLPKMSGMLLYGANKCGKSCCMKSVGINLIMAQAGMYVAADRFVFRPFVRVLTRILGNDNIFKGLSSFAVEMAELRGIMSRMDNRSLILGDEICHGTETDSAMALVAASLILLNRKKANFIFATHLHQLVNLPEIQSMMLSTSTQDDESQTDDSQSDNQLGLGLGVYHLKIEYNPADHSLIYNRNLRAGSGDSIYGIEVARAMDLDSELISLAITIRQRSNLGNLGPTRGTELLEAHPSRYNRNFYVDYCQVCHASKKDDDHHIKFQCSADENGMIGSMHKNELKNMAGVCKSCHDRIHRGEITVNGYVEGSGGLKLDFVIHPKVEPKKRLTFRV